MSAALAELQGVVAGCGWVMVDILHIFTAYLQRYMKLQLSAHTVSVMGDDPV